jgi:PEP-CTERM motif
MLRKCAAAVVGLLALVALSAAVAAPVTYRFSTGPEASAFPEVSGLFGGGATASGTFVYDSASPNTLVTSGLSVYGAFSPGSPVAPSFSSLTGLIGGLAFSDAQGVALVANDTFDNGGSLVDFFGLNADPSAASSSTRNIDGFSIGGYALTNVRLFWIETQQTPALIPDFLSSTDLPSSPPSFSGRLALDFSNSSTGAAAGSVFFDGLTVTPVPEPETYAMLLAGLGLLGVAAYRRRDSQLA